MDELDKALAAWATARSDHLKAMQVLEDAATSLAATIRITYGPHSGTTTAE